MICPACDYDNLPGSDRCEDCLEPLMKLDIPQPGVGLQQRLMEDAILQLNPTSPITTSAEAPIAEAIQSLKSHKVGCLLVMEGTRLVGILSERDLLYKLAGANRPTDQIKVKEVMTSHPVQLSPGDSIRFALHEMSVGGFRHIPVVQDESPVGIISIKDVLSYINRSVLDKHTDKTSSQVGSG